MARRNVKVTVPRADPDKVIELAEKISEQSAAAGDDCPLKGEPYMAPMAANTAKAKKLRKDAADLRAKAETMNAEANKLIGLAPGQTLTTEGTILAHVGNAKSRLLDRNRGKEKNLEIYGFPVTITESTPGKRKSSPAK